MANTVIDNLGTETATQATLDATPIVVGQRLVRDFGDGTSEEFVDVSATERKKIRTRGGGIVYRFNGTVNIPVSDGTVTMSSASFGPAQGENQDHRVIMRTGETLEGRSYFDWRNVGGVNSWLMGRNASNDFILFNADDTNPAHIMIAYNVDINGNANTELNSIGSGAVTINAGADGASGIGGLIVGSGGSGGDEVFSVNPTQTRFRSPLRIETAFNHLPVSATDAQPVIQTPAGVPYTQQFFIGTTLQWRQEYGTDGSIRFRNGLGDRVLNLTDNDNVGIGSDAFVPTAKLDVGGSLRVRGETTFGGTISLFFRTLATLPTSPGTAQVIYVSDIPGGGQPCFSRNGNWFTFTDPTTPL